jgi:hypothetical protein
LTPAFVVQANDGGKIQEVDRIEDEVCSFDRVRRIVPVEVAPNLSQLDRGVDRGEAVGQGIHLWATNVGGCKILPIQVMGSHRVSVGQNYLLDADANRRLGEGAADTATRDEDTRIPDSLLQFVRDVTDIAFNEFLVSKHVPVHPKARSLYRRIEVKF